MDLFDLKILSLNFDIGVDAIGPETNFTLETDRTSSQALRCAIAQAEKLTS